MKDKTNKVLNCILFLCLGIYIGLHIYSPLDANRDGKVNAQDYVIIKNFIMKGCDSNE